MKRFNPSECTVEEHYSMPLPVPIRPFRRILHRRRTLSEW